MKLSFIYLFIVLEPKVSILKEDLLVIWLDTNPSFLSRSVFLFMELVFK